MTSENRYTDYDPWAWLYNQSEAHKSCQQFLPKLEKLLLPHLPEGAKIFDLCCGTGQITQQLLIRGYQVTGLDGSEKMLDYARQNAPNAQFILGDARSFEFPSTFDAVICTDSALNHIMSLEELKSVFSNVYTALKADGLFLFDLGLEKRYRNIPVNEGKLENEYAWTIGETYNPEEKTGTFTITIFQPVSKNSDIKQNSSIVNPLKRLVYNKFLRLIKPSTLLQLIPKDWHPSDITFSAKPYAKAEIETALEAVGFTAVKAYNFKGKLASPQQNKYACFVARKTCQSFRSVENTAKELSASNSYS
ncbi:MAG: class I SAM-dependent methyltransferase [Coleofasciculus sp. C1-SOL-03]|uniref:class I SAM-dependent methyltransferase n=1 Tax=Coleofasciculus sp. C1-SOL-03 TaxID=3069522 RepID=UPI0032F85AC5